MNPSLKITCQIIHNKIFQLTLFTPFPKSNNLIINQIFNDLARALTELKLTTHFVEKY